MSRVWSLPSVRLVLLTGLLLLGAVMVLGPVTGASGQVVTIDVTLVPLGSDWSYLDDGSDQGTAWQTDPVPTWDTGPAELGYGDGDEATVVASGPPGNFHATTYFRHTVTVADASTLQSVAGGLVADDGGVVYVNGTEVFRIRMPAGPPSFNTLTQGGVAGAAEDVLNAFTVDPALFVDGPNEIAVEIHQISTSSSSDISMNLELTAVASVASPTGGALPEGCTDGQHAAYELATDTWVCVDPPTGGGAPPAEWLVFPQNPSVGLVSTDGVEWLLRYSTISTVAIASDGSQWVAVGFAGRLNTSPDGETWTARSSITTNSLQGVASDGSQWVAVGSSGTILSSPDGVAWTSQTSGTSQSLRGVASDGSQWVAVGSSGTILSSPDGVAWTSQTSGTSQSLRGVASDGSQWVAVGNSGTILTSPDGVAWTSQTSGTSQTLFGVASDGSQWVAVGSGGTILTSPDGVAWTSQTSGLSFNILGVASDGSQFVAAGNGMATSLDGITWTTILPGTYQGVATR